ncbi:MAG: type II secretion system F family protein [Candidatus Babeliaceae bacterium]|jgi:type II secretory pathway component PulF
MALYTYQALSRDGGKKISGTLDAPSITSVREQLTQRGLFATKIELATDASSTTSGFSWRTLLQKKVSFKDKIFFTKQLSMLLKSGVPLLNALELLTDQTEGGLRSIVVQLKDGIKEGRSLADGLSKFPRTFENIYIQLVRAGEASGRLEIILDRLTSYIERQQELRKKINKALTYPMLQLSVVGLVVIVLLTYVVPQIAQTFEGQGAMLPLSTRILMGMSSILVNYYYILLPIVITLVVMYRLWKATPQGARAIDIIKLKLPIIKYFTRTGAVVQFSRTLGMLIEAGVNLAEALSIVVKIVDNRVLADALQEARENILKQGKVAEYLKQTGIFPPVAIYLINTGEQSGHLDTMLLTVAEYYEVELADLADSLASKIDPIMLLVMAVIVGFIVMAIVTPMVGLNDIIGA